MLGVTAQVAAIDGLRLGPRQGTQVQAQAQVQSTHSDAALIDAIRRGDAGSREALYHRFKRRVFALAVRIVGQVDAEEVAQEAFIRIFAAWQSFAATRRWRRGSTAWRSTPPCPTARARPPVAEADGGEQAETLPGVEPARGDAVLRVRIERAMARLPTGYRTVIVLHDVEGLEHEEVASILGCHVGTSKSQLHKARGKLRELLAADGITAASLQDG